MGIKISKIEPNVLETETYYTIVINGEGLTGVKKIFLDIGNNTSLPLNFNTDEDGEKIRASIPKINTAGSHKLIFKDNDDQTLTIKTIKIY